MASTTVETTDSVPTQPKPKPNRLGSRIVRGLREAPQEYRAWKAGTDYDEAIAIAKDAKDGAKAIIAQDRKDAAVNTRGDRHDLLCRIALATLTGGWVWATLLWVAAGAVTWLLHDMAKADTKAARCPKAAAWARFRHTAIAVGTSAGMWLVNVVLFGQDGSPVTRTSFQAGWSPALLAWPVLAALAVLAVVVAWVGPDATMRDNLAGMAPEKVEHDGRPEIVKAVIATKALPQETTPMLVQPGVVYRNDGQIWTATLDTMGPSAEKLLPAGPRAELAARLGLSTRRLILTVDEDRGSRLHLTGIVGQPWRTGPSPLLRLDPVNLWNGIPWAMSLEGELITYQVFERNGLLGGESGAGKSTALAGIWAAFALGVFGAGASKIYAIDGGDVDTRPLADSGLASGWTTELTEGIKILREVRDEVNRRQALLGDAKVRKANPDWFAEHCIGFDLMLIDEVARFTQRKGVEATMFSDLMREIAQNCRKVGIHLVLSTQSPSVDAIEGDARDVLPVRWLGRAMSVDLGNKVLGKGAAGRGLSPATLPQDEDSRGVGWYVAPGHQVQARPFDWTDDALAAVCRRGVELRRGATVATAADEDRILADRVAALIRSEGFTVPQGRVMPARDVAGRLAVDQMQLREALGRIGTWPTKVSRPDDENSHGRMHYMLSDLPVSRAI